MGVAFSTFQNNSYRRQRREAPGIAEGKWTYPRQRELLAMTDLPALTSLRFFAAAMVVLVHIQGSFGVPALPGWNLNVGVSLFFTLSGFILTYQYPALPTRQDRKTFYWKRFARIWPAHIVAALLVLLIVPNAMDLPPAEKALAFVTNALMVQTWVPVAWVGYSINGPSWSISTECFFYLMFPLLILNFDRTWWWKLALSFGVIVVLACLFELVIDRADPHRGASIFRIFYVYPEVRIFEFIGGMVAALAWRRWSEHLRFSVAAATVIEAAAVVCFVLFLDVGIWQALVVGESVTNLHPLVNWLLMSGAAVVPGGALIFALSLGRGLISRAMSLPLLVVLGEMSYAIYLLHATLLRAYEANPQRFSDVSPALMLAAFVAALLLLSWALFNFVERTARRAILARTGAPVALADSQASA
jgi:peptidoglycan/LPS O-acetylase OafA/YrhL